MYQFIVNPASKSGKGNLLWKELELYMKGEEVPYEAHLSEKPGDIARIMRELTAPYATGDTTLFPADPAPAEGCMDHPDDYPLKVIVLGGDGTLNEALQGVCNFSKTAIGYIPTGSSNDMARDLGVKLPPIQTLKSILRSDRMLHMDLGELTYNNISDEKSRLHDDSISSMKRYFGVSSDIGFGAAVCEQALSSKGKNVLNTLGLGKLSYLNIALHQLMSIGDVSAELYLDDNPDPIHLNRIILLAGMIHCYEGGGFKFCPHAVANDGLLDICAIGDLSTATILKALPTAYAGNHFKYDHIDEYRAKSYRVETSAPLWVHTDGEVSVKSSSISLTCLEKRLHFIDYLYD
ncbi:MAG: diacylglycerol kinase family lipid kinase [Lachnospiraceae bacterium]|nr:diacylglycerol kinase family lipid kinase [Lachnospiraceae bacterium]